MGERGDDIGKWRGWESCGIPGRLRWAGRDEDWGKEDPTGGRAPARRSGVLAGCVGLTGLAQ
jgi:hypothetical protein